MFPQVDPIPLPAPVWLFKVLEVLTVSLHFSAVQVLIGGLLVGTTWSLLGRRKENRITTDAAGVVVCRLPIVMTYVINLGVPPLLFAQVLYGRALYTSSILIGAFWIAVVFLLTVGYALLYLIVDRAKDGKAWGWIGLVVLLITAKIAMIYSSNMTLMIRPQVWLEMYRSDPHGLHWNGGDPTVLPRWLFMMLGGLSLGGAGLMFLGMKKKIGAETSQFLRLWGARLVVVGIPVQAVVGYWVIRAQPESVQSALGASGLYRGCLVIWVAAGLLLVVVGLRAQARAASPSWLWPGLTGGLALLEVVATVVFRGGIRDVTLLARGFDVWERQVASNWIVLSAFPLFLVLGLAVLFWLATVVVRAQGVEERYA